MNIRLTEASQLIAVSMAFLVSVAITGCGGIAMEVLEEVAKTPEDFLLGPEDVLEVVVWRNQDLSREVVIRPDGKVSMPLVGDVQASGLTADQLAERIAERLKEFKENPVVSVSVKEVNSYNVYVLGEVSKPGKFQLKSYTTVLQAIAMAGGFTPYASRNKMKVVRNSANGEGELREIHIPVHYNDVLSGKGKLGNFMMKTGDILVVP